MRNFKIGAALAVAAMAVCPTMGLAQENENLNTTNNVIKVNYGPGLVYSYTYDHPGGNTKSTSSAFDLSLDYAHTFGSGFGFGVNVIQSHLEHTGLNDFYVGASAYYGKTACKGKWYFDGSVGAGYAANDLDDKHCRNGFGIFAEVGAHYKLSRHFGVGAELRNLRCIYKRPKAWKDFYGSFGTARATLAFGLQYYF